MSFDPAPIAALRTLAPRLPRGIVAERRYTHPEWSPLSARTKRALAYFQHALQSRPQFIAYSVKDLAVGDPAAGTERAAPAVADLDGAHRCGPRARGALRRPDDL